MVFVLSIDQQSHHQSAVSGCSRVFVFQVCFLSITEEGIWLQHLLKLNLIVGFTRPA